MSQYTDLVKASADAVEKAEQQFIKANERLNTVRGHNGQSGYSVSVNGVTVAVSQCDHRTYQGTLIRGREMIHLGALKALGAELQTAKEYLLKCRKHLASVVINP